MKTFMAKIEVYNEKDLDHMVFGEETTCEERHDFLSQAIVAGICLDTDSTVDVKVTVWEKE